MILWALDPAASKPHAFAEYRDQTLVRSWLARDLAEAVRGAERLPDVLVVERPRVYRESAADPNDVLAVDRALYLLVGGLTLGLCFPAPQVFEYLPEQWKGQVAKPKHHARLWRVLTEPERELLGGAATLAKIEIAQRQLAFGKKPSYQWSMGDRLDAAALGAFQLGRIPKGG